MLVSARFPLVVALSAVVACAVEDHVAPAELALALRSGPLAPAAAPQSPTATAMARRVLRFAHAPDTHTARRITQLGARIDAVLPGNGYVVSIAAQQSSALDGLSDLTWSMPYPARAKVAPEVTALGADSGARVPDSAVTLVVETFVDADTARLAQAFDHTDIAVISHRTRARFGRLVVRTSTVHAVRVAETLASHPDVFWIGIRGYRALLNDTSIWVGQSGLEGGEATPLFEQGLRGQGQIAAVLDTGLDVDHCAFWDEANGNPPANQDGATEVDLMQRKVIAYDFLYTGDDPNDDTHWDDQGHGTHVAGTVAGDQDGNGTHDGTDGMAPAAKLVIQDGGYQTNDCADLPALGCPVVDLHPIFEQAYAQGARVHNNSWGDRENFSDQDLYSDGCQDVDEFMWENPDFLLVFAAGNSGPGAGSVGSPAVAKNTLAVGATQRASASTALAGFSSRGPTADGRLKPDVTFPGSGIQSASNDRDITTSNCSANGSSGTSMAAPGAAGMAVLARQYFADGFYPSGVASASDAFSPSAALVKAALIQSATTMTDESAVPSMDQGWGRIQLDTALAFADSDFVLFVDDVAPGLESPADGPVAYTIEVLDTNAPLKATLVWTDFPSTPAASTNLVNDLDLTLDGPSGAFLGNVYADGASTTGGSADRLNNVEQLSIPVPSAGTHVLEVVPHAIPMGPQPYALVITGNIEVQPPGGDDGGSDDSGGGDTSDGGSGDTDDTGSDDTGDSGTGDTGTDDGSDTGTGDMTTDDSDSETDTDVDDDTSTGDDDTSDTGGEADDDSNTGDDDADTGDSDDDDDDDDDGSGTEDDGSDNGCTCHTSGGRRDALAWLGLGLLTAAGRRRRSRART